MAWRYNKVLDEVSLNKSDKILVTGAGGYLASSLARTLAELGFSVKAMYRSKTNDYLKHPNIELTQGDLLDSASLEKAIEGCTYIFHVAAYADNWAKDPSNFYKVNVGGTLLLLDLAKKHGVKRTVVTSTAGTIGPANDNGLASESNYRQVGFFGDYEQSKIVADERIYWRVQDGEDIVIACPTRIFGPGVMGRSNTITHIVNQYRKGKWKVRLGDGSDKANYGFINDVVAGHILCLEKGKAGNKYLLGGENLTFNGFIDSVKQVEKVNHKLLPIPFGIISTYTKLEDFLADNFGVRPKMTHAWAKKLQEDWSTDCSKAKNELGYTITPINQAIKETTTWLKEQGY